MPKDPNELGALWNKTSKKGAEFMSGTINGQEVVCFRNTGKTGNQPDWRVMKSQPRDNYTKGDAKRDAPEREDAERTYGGFD